jgi:methylated-DNA-[protein]-cysteine S-methyltransferase
MEGTTMIELECLSVCHSIYPSPIGDLLLTSDGESLTGLYMCQHKGRPAAGPEACCQRDDSAFQSVSEQLAAYFCGELRDFDIPLRMPGTPFQCQVWEGLRAIPYGSTVSYAELARRIGRPGASRAVGSANGRNPISIVVPCHRVIAADGTLGGYGGGLERKEWLLEHETSVRKSANETHPARRHVATCLAVD